VSADGDTIAVTRCWIHRGLFECSLGHVCTTWVDGRGGVVERGEPGARQVDICDPCIIEVNKVRAARGLEPFETAAEHAARQGDTRWAGEQ
jgi:hypothetical protein